MKRRNLLKDFSNIIRRIDETRRWHIIRRMVHVFLSVSIIYYLFPSSLWLVELPKWILLPLAVLIVVVVEIVRLSRGDVFKGMRDHEQRAVGSYVYAVIGIATVLALCPPEIGVPAIVGMAICDPLAGELRLINQKRRNVVITTLIVYAIIVAISAAIIGTGVGLATALIMTMTPVAIISEGVNLRNFDDDFLMLFFPAVAGMLVLSALTG